MTFRVSYIFALILFIIKETPEERAYFKKQHQKLNAEIEEEKREKKFARKNNHLTWRQKREERRRKQAVIEKEREELYKKQVQQWQTEDLALYATSVEDLKLKKTESAYYIGNDHVTWSESRSKTKRVNYGGLTGSVHIAKGLNYRMGSIKTESRKEEYMKDIISGLPILTNKRIIIANANEAKSYPYTRLLKITPFSDGTELVSDSGKVVMLRGFSDATKFNIYLDRLSGGEDLSPKSISEIDTIDPHRKEVVTELINGINQDLSERFENGSVKVELNPNDTNGTELNLTVPDFLLVDSNDARSVLKDLYNIIATRIITRDPIIHYLNNDGQEKIEVSANKSIN